MTGTHRECSNFHLVFIRVVNVFVRKSQKYSGDEIFWFLIKAKQKASKSEHDDEGSY